MDLDKLLKVSIGTFIKKNELVEGKKFKIKSLEEKEDNFKAGRKNLILGIEDNKKNLFLLQISKTNFNTLIDMYGADFNEGWKNNLVKITAVSDGVKDVEGEQRECFSLNFEKA